MSSSKSDLSNNLTSLDFNESSISNDFSLSNDFSQNGGFKDSLTDNLTDDLTDNLTDDLTQEGGFNGRLSALTWNITKNSGSPIPAVGAAPGVFAFTPGCTYNPATRMSDCLSNIIATLTNTKADIIALQNTDPHVNSVIGSQLSNMSHRNVSPLPGQGEPMSVYWNSSRLQLDQSEHLISGPIMMGGRVEGSYMALFFNRRLGVINVHKQSPSPITPMELSTVITSDINANGMLNFGQKNTLISKLKRYDLIILGDFNSDLGAGNTLLKFFGRDLNGTNTQFTCCETPIGAKNMNKIMDHVLSTISGVDITMVPYNSPSSKHAPVMGTITKGYGYSGVSSLSPFPSFMVLSPTKPRHHKHHKKGSHLTIDPIVHSFPGVLGPVVQPVISPMITPVVSPVLSLAPLGGVMRVPIWTGY